MNKLNYDDFFEQTWDYVSEKIVNDRYFRDNQSFIRAITKDFFDSYLIEDISIKTCGRLIEAFFFNLFEHRPQQEKNCY